MLSLLIPKKYFIASVCISSIDTDVDSINHAHSRTSECLKNISSEFYTNFKSYDAVNIFLIPSQSLSNLSYFGSMTRQVDLQDAQLRILSLISKHRKRGISQSDIGHVLHIDAKTIFYHVKVLEIHRLVIKIPVIRSKKVSNSTNICFLAELFMRHKDEIFRGLGIHIGGSLHDVISQSTHKVTMNAFLNMSSLLKEALSGLNYVVASDIQQHVLKIDKRRFSNIKCKLLERGEIQQFNTTIDGRKRLCLRLSDTDTHKTMNKQICVGNNSSHRHRSGTNNESQLNLLPAAKTPKLSDIVPRTGDLPFIQDELDDGEEEEREYEDAEGNALIDFNSTALRIKRQVQIYKPILRQMYEFIYYSDDGRTIMDLVRKMGLNKKTITTWARVLVDSYGVKTVLENKFKSNVFTFYIEDNNESPIAIEYSPPIIKLSDGGRIEQTDNVLAIKNEMPKSVLKSGQASRAILDTTNLLSTCPKKNSPGTETPSSAGKLYNTEECQCGFRWELSHASRQQCSGCEHVIQLSKDVYCNCVSCPGSIYCIECSLSTVHAKHILLCNTQEGVYSNRLHLIDKSNLSYSITAQSRHRIGFIKEQLISLHIIEKNELISILTKHEKIIRPGSVLDKKTINRLLNYLTAEQYMQCFALRVPFSIYTTSTKVYYMSNDICLHNRDLYKILERQEDKLLAPKKIHRVHLETITNVNRVFPVDKLNQPAKSSGKMGRLDLNVDKRIESNYMTSELGQISDAVVEHHNLSMELPIKPTNREVRQDINEQKQLTGFIFERIARIRELHLYLIASNNRLVSYDPSNSMDNPSQPKNPEKTPVLCTQLILNMPLNIFARTIGIIENNEDIISLLQSRNDCEVLIKDLDKKYITILFKDKRYFTRFMGNIKLLESMKLVELHESDDITINNPFLWINNTIDIDISEQTVSEPSSINTQDHNQMQISPDAINNIKVEYVSMDLIPLRPARLRRYSLVTYENAEKFWEDLEFISMLKVNTLKYTLKKELDLFVDSAIAQQESATLGVKNFTEFSKTIQYREFYTLLNKRYMAEMDKLKIWGFPNEIGLQYSRNWVTSSSNGVNYPFKENHSTRIGIAFNQPGINDESRESKQDPQFESFFGSSTGYIHNLPQHPPMLMLRKRITKRPVFRPKYKHGTQNNSDNTLGSSETSAKHKLAEISYHLERFVNVKLSKPRSTHIKSMIKDISSQPLGTKKNYSSYTPITRFPPKLYSLEYSGKKRKRDDDNVVDTRRLQKNKLQAVIKRDFTEDEIRILEIVRHISIFKNFKSVPYFLVEFFNCHTPRNVPDIDHDAVITKACIRNQMDSFILNEFKQYMSFVFSQELKIEKYSPTNSFDFSQTKIAGKNRQSSFDLIEKLVMEFDEFYSNRYQSINLFLSDNESSIKDILSQYNLSVLILENKIPKLYPFVRTDGRINSEVQVEDELIMTNRNELRDEFEIEQPHINSSIKIDNRGKKFDLDLLFDDVNYHLRYFFLYNFCHVLFIQPITPETEAYAMKMYNLLPTEFQIIFQHFYSKSIINNYKISNLRGVNRTGILGRIRPFLGLKLSVDYGEALYLAIYKPFFFEEIADYHDKIKLHRWSFETDVDCIKPLKFGKFGDLMSIFENIAVNYGKIECQDFKQVLPEVTQLAHVEEDSDANNNESFLVEDKELEEDVEGEDNDVDLRFQSGNTQFDESLMNLSVFIDHPITFSEALSIGKDPQLMNNPILVEREALLTRFVKSFDLNKHDGLTFESIDYNSNTYADDNVSMMNQFYMDLIGEHINQQSIDYISRLNVLVKWIVKKGVNGVSYQNLLAYIDRSGLAQNLSIPNVYGCLNVSKLIIQNLLNFNVCVELLASESIIVHIDYSNTYMISRPSLSLNKNIDLLNNTIEQFSESASSPTIDATTLIDKLGDSKVDLIEFLRNGSFNTSAHLLSLDTNYQCPVNIWSTFKGDYDYMLINSLLKNIASLIQSYPGIIKPDLITKLQIEIMDAAFERLISILVDIGSITLEHYSQPTHPTLTSSISDNLMHVYNDMPNEHILDKRNQCIFTSPTHNYNLQKQTTYMPTNQCMNRIVDYTSNNK